MHQRKRKRKIKIEFSNATATTCLLEHDAASGSHAGSVCVVLYSRVHLFTSFSIGRGHLLYTYLSLSVKIALGQNYLGPPSNRGIDPPLFFHFLAP